MKRILTYVGLPLLVACFGLCGCNHWHGSTDYNYTVTVHVGDSLRCDSCTLHVVDSEYQRQMVMGTAKNTGSFMRFSGQTDVERVAFLTFDALQKPFYFVLEPGQISITINRRDWSIAGGKANADYTRVLAEHQRLVAERERNQNHYRQSAADSTLTLRTERRAVVRDSMLADSLQRFLTRNMQRNDAVGHIVRERFATTHDTPRAKNR